MQDHYTGHDLRGRYPEVRLQLKQKNYTFARFWKSKKKPRVLAQKIMFILETGFSEFDVKNKHKHCITHMLNYGY